MSQALSPASPSGPPPRAAKVLTVIGLALLTIFAFAALAAPVIAPYDPASQVAPPFSDPSRQHLLGTDDLGQDLLSELIFGARVSLATGIVAAAVATLLATVAGLTAGLLRGWLDAILMRTVDAVLAVPLLPLLLVVSAFFDPGRTAMVLITGLILTPRAAREIRSQALAVSNLGPVDAARSMGAGPLHLLSRHLLPGAFPVVAAQFVRAVAVAIIFEASLSFLGLGDPTSRSWGTMLFFANARGAFVSDAWLWWVAPPGLCIGMTVVAFALIGFGLEERTDPRLRAGNWRLKGGQSSQGRRPQAPDPNAPLLVVEHLTIDYEGRETIRALDSLSLNLSQGELLVLGGPSGSGKSTLAAAILGLIRAPGGTVAGRVLVEGRDLAGLSSEELRRLRGKVVALVPQAAMNALNPVVRVLDQVAEAVRVHQPVGRSAARGRARELLATVGLAPERVSAFPHELSGGMRQRVAIAMAIANEPRLIVADEPAAGLDVVAQLEILALLTDLRERLGVAMIVISHDRPAMLMRGARLMELAKGQAVSPCSAPHLSPASTAPAILVPAQPDGTRPSNPPILEVSHLRKSFHSARNGQVAEVLRGVDMHVGQAEVVGLIGRSGTGKTTLARVLTGLTKPGAGRLVFNGVELLDLPGRRQRAARRDLQLVGQDPYGWLAPRMSVRQLVAEPLVIHRVGRSDGGNDRVSEALADVGLQPTARYLDRYPHELSGGERQRVAFARAIVLAPALIVADEPTSMLDINLRQEIVQLIGQLRDRRKIAFLYITHDIALARSICDRVLVMEEGRIIEECESGQLGSGIHHPATERLLDAAKTLAGI